MGKFNPEKPDGKSKIEPQLTEGSKGIVTQGAVFKDVRGSVDQEVAEESKKIPQIDLLLGDCIEFFWRNPDAKLSIVLRKASELLKQIQYYDRQNLRNEFYQKYVAEEKNQTKKKAAEIVINELFK